MLTIGRRYLFSDVSTQAMSITRSGASPSNRERTEVPGREFVLKRHFRCVFPVSSALWSSRSSSRRALTGKAKLSGSNGMVGRRKEVWSVPGRSAVECLSPSFAVSSRNLVGIAWCFNGQGNLMCCGLIVGNMMATQCRPSFEYRVVGNDL